MLVLSNDEIESLITMPDCFQVLEDAYRALAEDRAMNVPRVDSLLELNAEAGQVYSFKTMGGAIRGSVQALRINSDVIHWPEIDGNRRRVKIPAAKGGFVGLVYLFDASTGLPLAIMPDGVLQHLRVGAANGLAAKYLAPRQVDTVALLGTGWQAETQLLAIDFAVSPVRVKVFSPAPEHRRDFCRRMQARVAAVLSPATSAEEAVSGAQVVLAATNTMVPVLNPDWVRPGTHFSTVKPQEVGPDFLQRTRVYLHSKGQAKADVISAGRVPRFEEASGWWKSKDVMGYPDLVDLVTGKDVGRRKEADSTLFVNNVGMGLQFAAVGAFVLERAYERSVGRTLPDEWFIEAVHP